MNTLYESIKQKELRNNNADWSFAAEMQKASRNPKWVNNIGLWALLSGACDDAASKCYDHINRFSKDLIDIDTCNIHALKSIAKSVDLGYLCKHINDDEIQFLDEVVEMINLFSIPKHYLLNSDSIISYSANDLLFGETTKRLRNHNDDYVTIDLIKNIRKNIYHIKNILNFNIILTSKTLRESLNSDLTDLKLDDKNDVLDMSLNDIIDIIANFNDNDERLSDFRRQVIDLNAEHNSSLSDKDEKLPSKINYFYLLINVIKQNAYNEKRHVFIEPGYFNKEMNINIDLRPLFIDIINVISGNNENYIRYFICFHFYNLLKDKIKNERLRNMFSYENKTFISQKTNFSLYSESVFEGLLDDILCKDEFDELINPSYKIKKNRS